MGIVQVENNMIAENADRLRSRVSELESELLNKTTSKGSDKSGGGGDGSGGENMSSGADESSDERAAVMHGLLKELRAELMHKEEVQYMYVDVVRGHSYISLHFPSIALELLLASPICLQKIYISSWFYPILFAIVNFFFETVDGRGSK